MLLSATTRREKFAQVALVAVGYFAMARFGLSLAFATTQVTAVWPPTGLALAALVLIGPRAAWGVYVGAFAANAMAKEPMGVVASIALGNTLTGLAGWWMLRMARISKPSFGEIREVVALAVVALATPLLSASSGVSCLMLGGLVPGSAFGSVWRVWWMGDGLGILLVTPLLLTWAVPVRLSWNRRQAAEIASLLLSLAFVGGLVFCGARERTGIYFRAYAAFPLLIWSALRFGTRATVTMAVGIACFAIWGTVHGRGPFAVGPLDDRLLELDVFIGVTGLTALFMGAVTTERQEAQRRLAVAHGDLERKVDERTTELASANADLERKHEEVEASNHFLETILEHLPTALVLKSAREQDFGVITRWNPSAERTFGIPREKAIGRTVLDFFHPRESARVMAKDREVASSKHLAVIPDGTFHVDGLGTRHLRTSIVPLKNMRGIVEQLLVLSTDITDLILTEDALRKSEHLHRSMVESLSEGVILQNRDGSLFKCNARAQEIMGLSASQMRDFDALQPHWQAVHEDGTPWPRESRPSRRALDTGESVDGAIMGIQKPDGTLSWVRVNARPIQMAHESDSTCVVTSFSDFTLEKYYRDSLLRSEQRYALAVKAGRAGILDLDLQTKSVHYSGSWKSMIGYAPDEIGNRPEELLGRIHPEDLVLAMEALRAHIKGETPEFQCEIRVQHKNGAWLWLLSRGIAVRDAKGRALRVTGSQTDISAQKTLEERLHREATRDELTGLYNRRHFSEAFQAYLDGAAIHGHTLSLAIGDLDHFKHVNDTYGHPSGDEVIKRFADKIGGILRGKDLAARIGGDEFCVLFPFTTAKQAALGLERLRSGLAEEVFQGPEGQPFGISATFGVAELVPGMNQEQLMKMADDALYEAKRQGRNRVVVATETWPRPTSGTS
ncbi:MAG TPA: diguanylate cyclase [Holophagaceae bacterium]|nr:diguanylate cyclase [Holophagaceae bacterium]